MAKRIKNERTSEGGERACLAVLLPRGVECVPLGHKSRGRGGHSELNGAAAAASSGRSVGRTPECPRRERSLQNSP